MAYHHDANTPLEDPLVVHDYPLRTGPSAGLNDSLDSDAPSGSGERVRRQGFPPNLVRRPFRVGRNHEPGCSEVEQTDRRWNPSDMSNISRLTEPPFSPRSSRPRSRRSQAVRNGTPRHF